MARPIIEVTDLSKSYSIGKRESYGSLREEIMQALASPFRRKSDRGSEAVWALKDVSFEVEEGTVLGIIGRNGAGKSTLLKILSRITEPTTGRVTMRGRVASLLEVGTGFHPELTGRENIFLNGALLGMTSAEIRSKFDEIVAFSEIEKFLDTPVKRYSSGMYVRLAFAVAAHLEPEILIVDEVLAVGDAAFQKKCLGKIGDVARGGRTVLFVSHNMGAVKELCTSAILISRGSIAQRGAPPAVAESYLRPAGNDGGKGEISWPDRKSAPGGKDLRLVSVRLLDQANRAQSSFDGEKPVKVEITYELFEVKKNMGIILQILNSDGIVIFTSADHTLRGTETQAGLYRSVCTIPGGLLNSGVHLVKIYADCPGVAVLLEGQVIIDFKIERTFRYGALFYDRWQGVVTPRLDWEVHEIGLR